MGDFYPVNDYSPLMPGLVIGGMAVVHVFLAQFAVGGGMLLCYFQWLAMTGRNVHARRFVGGYFKALVLVSFVAGALTGGGASNPANKGRLANGMLSIYFEPQRFGEGSAFSAEVRRFVEWVKSSRKAQPNGEILMPGDLEEKTKARRLAEGIELDANTWQGIADVCKSLNVSVESV